MAEATTTEIFNAPIDKVYDIITDYNHYADFMTDVKRVSVIEAQADRKLVEFELQIIKTFRYQVWLKETPKSEVSWTFHTGEIFKDNSGSWKLQDLGNGTTKVDYTVNAKFGVFVPGMIEKKLVQSNLPSMIKAFKTHVEK